jgi:ABC-type lipoprotein export system ATPase subunit
MITHDKEIAANAKRMINVRDGKVISDMITYKEIEYKESESMFQKIHSCEEGE